LDGKRWSLFARSPKWIVKYHVNRPTVPTIQWSYLYAFKDYHSALMFMQECGTCDYELWECDGVIAPVPRVLVITPHPDAMTWLWRQYTHVCESGGGCRPPHGTIVCSSITLRRRRAVYGLKDNMPNIFRVHPDGTPYGRVPEGVAVGEIPF